MLGAGARGGEPTSCTAAKIGISPTLVEATTFLLEANDFEGRFELLSMSRFQWTLQKKLLSNIFQNEENLHPH